MAAAAGPPFGRMDETTEFCGFLVRPLRMCGDPPEVEIAWRDGMFSAACHDHATDVPRGLVEWMETHPLATPRSPAMLLYATGNIR